MSFEKSRHSLGFYQANPLPTDEELEKHYRDVYFQQSRGSYAPEYTPDEKTYFRNRGVISEKIWRDHGGSETGKMLDVGCGEGFIAAYFLERKWAVEAMDFSSFGVERQNPAVAPFFKRGNIYHLLEEAIRGRRKFDFVNLSNVLEHVRDPLGLLDRLKSLMHSKTMLRINVPNDFSNFQRFLVQKEFTGETWFAPPEHLNYFTFESLRAVLEDRGFTIRSMIAGFPVEVLLVNDHANYWKDRTKGKQAHKTRVLVDNFLIEQNLEEYIRYVSSAARLHFGRDVIAYTSCDRLA